MVMDVVPEGLVAALCAPVHGLVAALRHKFNDNV
jgi:hypothetical protein